MQDSQAATQGLNERTRAILSILEGQFKEKVCVCAECGCSSPSSRRLTRVCCLSRQVSVSFTEVTSGVPKRVAASAFLEILQLKTRGLIEATQEVPFGEITLQPAICL